MSTSVPPSTERNVKVMLTPAQHRSRSSRRRVTECAEHAVCGNLVPLPANRDDFGPWCSTDCYESALERLG